jgi:hypothetical protein
MTIQVGDRFRVTRAVDPISVLVIQKAPAHTSGTHGVLPADTVIVAMDQAPDATEFLAYPQEYDALEASLVPADVRSSPKYAAYGLSFPVDEVGDLLEQISPLDPRPENRLPR